MILVIGLLGLGLILILMLALSARRRGPGDPTSAADSGPMNSWWLGGSGHDHDASHGGHASSSDASSGDSGGGEGGGGD